MRGFPARLGESGCKSPAVPVTVIPLGFGQFLFFGSDGYPPYRRLLHLEVTVIEFLMLRVTLIAHQFFLEIGQSAIERFFIFQRTIGRIVEVQV